MECNRKSRQLKKKLISFRISVFGEYGSGIVPGDWTNN